VTDRSRTKPRDFLFSMGNSSLKASAKMGNHKPEREACARKCDNDGDNDGDNNGDNDGDLRVSDP
jgi:hypothetical protein